MQNRRDSEQNPLAPTNFHCKVVHFPAFVEIAKKQRSIKNFELDHINFKTKVRIKNNVLLIPKRFGAFYTMITSIMTKEHIYLIYLYDGLSYIPHKGEVNSTRTTRFPRFEITRTSVEESRLQGKGG